MRLKALAPFVCAPILLGGATRCTATDPPETRRGDLVLRVTPSAGMLPEGGELDLAATACGLTQPGEGRADGGAGVGRTVTLIARTATPADLDALYQALRESRFGRFQTYTQQTCDRGGTTISVTLGSQSIWAEDGRRPGRPVRVSRDAQGALAIAAAP